MIEPTLRSIVTRGAFTLLCCLALGIRPTIAAADLRTAVMFDIPAQQLPSALLKFAVQSGVQVTSPAQLVEGKSSEGVIGTFNGREALQRILKHTELQFEIVDENTVMIVPAGARSTTAIGAQPPEPTGTEPADTGTNSESHGRVRLSQAEGRAAIGEAPNDTGGVTLEEIVVTAQKRAERLQDVPVPVTAIDVGTLASTNQLRLQDYYTEVPGLSVAPVTAAGNEQVLTIRGIGTGLGTNPTVGVTVDDVPFGSSTFTGGSAVVPDLDPADLARIEVLRGPQGTLYGASSMGGLVKFVTLDPATTESSGRVEATLSGVSHGDGTGYGVRGSVNLPLSETLAVRVSGFSRRDPGYIDNPGYGLRGINDDHAYGGHLALLWRPSEDFSIKLSALLQRLQADSSNNVDVPDANYPQTAALGMWQQLDLPGFSAYESKVQAYSATIHARLGRVELTSVSGYNINRSFSAADLTYLFQAPSGDVVNAQSRKFTQEVRLSGPLGTRFDWLAGAFYTHESAPSAGNYFLIDPASLQNAGELFDQTAQSTYVEYAGFADLTLHVTDRVSVQLGGRESQIKESFGQALATPGFPTAITPELTVKNNAFTYLLTPQMKLSPDAMVYARLASGYRAGGPNNSPGVPLLSFKPDRSYNYELGLKADAYDHRLSIDTSVYYIDWRDIQLNLVDSNTLFTYTGNAGKAKSRGIELAVEARPARNTRLAGWIDWNDATLSENLPLETFVLGGAYGARGDRLPYSARLSGNLSIRQDIPFTAQWLGSFGLSASYVGDRLGEFPTPSAATLAPPQVPPVPPRQAFGGYAIVNLHASLRYGLWTGNVFVTNALNRQAALAGGLGGFPPFAFTYIQPRVIGAGIVRQF